MNYFEIINKCLMELNYQPCKTFTNLTKNDHLKIKNIINVINSEVCNSDEWNFLLRKMSLVLPKNTSEITNAVEGRICSLSIDNTKYSYSSDFEQFVMNKRPSYKYSVFNDKLLFSQFENDKTIEVIYYTNKFAQDDKMSDVAEMTSETDKSVIPDAFAETILVYGTCMRFKGNPEYTKFNYWYSMYKAALATMRSRIGTDAEEIPKIKLYRA